MRAIGVQEFGGPEVLRVVDLPEPHPGPGEVRIRVRAAAVNPTDLAIRDGSRRAQLEQGPGPYVPGMDVAGEVDEVGEPVDGTPVWQRGDRVVAIVVPSGSHGAYAEQVVVPSTSVAPIPSGASFAEAATLPMNGLTARQTLDRLALPPGALLGVTGAAGAYGGYVVQLAVADGLRVVVDAAEADEELVRSLGAHDVVRRGEGVGERMRAVVPDGLAAVADGALLHEQVVPAIEDGGGLAVVRGWDGEPGRGITVHRIAVRDYAQEGDRLDRLRAQVEAGLLTLRVARTLPAERAEQAHRELEAGGVRGRLVLEFS